MPQLIYRIADQYLVLHTPDPLATAAILPNYEPFRQPSIPDEIEPIVEVWGNCTCSQDADDKLLEEVNDIYYYSRVYKHGDGTRIEMKHLGVEEVGCFSADWRKLHCRSALTNSQARYLIDRLIMIAFSIVTAGLKMLKVHASVTELDGRALIFLGVSGTGKSTHSRLWRELVPGATLLNDDEPIVRVMPDGSIRVYGCPWSGSTPCYRDRSADVAAFVHLYQSPENKLTKLGALQAFDSLFSSSAFMLSESKVRQQVFNTVADVLERIPVYRLDCRPDAEAVSLTKSLLQ
ncbi:MAG: hypothetical protein Q4A64_08945 [Porphyromonadaceae bacterium]|nr:hypothetical protein [Porphyromonadaceae bacterium]